MKTKNKTLALCKGEIFEKNNSGNPQIGVYGVDDPDLRQLQYFFPELGPVWTQRHRFSVSGSPNPIMFCCVFALGIWDNFTNPFQIVSPFVSAINLQNFRACGAKVNPPNEDFTFENSQTSQIVRAPKARLAWKSRFLPSNLPKSRIFRRSQSATRSQKCNKSATQFPGSATKVQQIPKVQHHLKSVTKV